MNKTTGDTDMKIKSIVSVIDTREWIEGDNDKWVPVAGSGQENECMRCGRLHEVHATVELENGQHAIVGTGCMSADSMDPAVANALKSGATTAKTLARLQAQLVKLEKQLAFEAELQPRIEAELDKIAFATTVEQRENVTIHRLGNASVWVHGTGANGVMNSERRTCLWESWKKMRFDELGGGFETGRKLRETKERLAKSEARLAKVLS
jgi:hypothetical protein